ncbi:MAG TPA: allantoicase [Candidatus Acidoferrales bacterium]|jgi:allantoicase|nr:allantoicase [Candidatus Acidoferrales bacterium]
MDFTEYIDLAAERLGGRVVAANDEFFAPKENLLKAAAPVWIEGKYTDVGKWMDGWETRRRRTPGYDWCIVKLGLPGVIHGVVVDTSYFKGNFPEHCELESCAVDGDPGLAQLEDHTTKWNTMLKKSPLAGDTRNPFPLTPSSRVTHLRFKIYPDGGVARLRVHGEAVPDWPALTRARGDIDLAAVEHGGWVIVSSDMFFGSRNNLILPGRSTGMHDGWETRRRRGPGHDWCIVRLGAHGKISRIEVDTSHFKGNFPESCSLEVCTAPRDLIDPDSLGALPWKEILTRTKLQADSLHIYEKELLDARAVTHARFHIYPDGGVARLRIFGTPAKTAR